MKKFLASLIAVGLFAGVCFANVLPSVGSWPLSSDWEIKNTTCTLADTAYSMALSSGTSVSLTLQAKGGDIRLCKAGTTTEAYFTIGQDQSFYDHFPLPLPASTTLYFWSATAGSTLEVLVNYR